MPVGRVESFSEQEKRNVERIRNLNCFICFLYAVEKKPKIAGKGS
jgi:uncharacterized radical SAM superfamily Fe-S cluster-containing enzyme